MSSALLASGGFDIEHRRIHETARNYRAMMRSQQTFVSIVNEDSTSAGKSIPSLTISYIFLLGQHKSSALSLAIITAVVGEDF
jgi:hypothetical protein